MDDLPRKCTNMNCKKNWNGPREKGSTPLKFACDVYSLMPGSDVPVCMMMDGICCEYDEDYMGCVASTDECKPNVIDPDFCSNNDWYCDELAPICKRDVDGISCISDVTPAQFPTKSFMDHAKA